ncbi:excalibur calcium-binding domain-containing protein [Aeromonas veronii]
MRYQGRIASWNEARGFGFITPEQNGAEQAINGARSAGLFVHVTALQSDGRVPEPGERVTYLIGSGQDGKPRALQVFFPDRPLTLADAVPSSASSAAPLPVSSFNQEEVSTPQATTFIRQCDGRQHCSQMTSCEEATWFLQHCPNTKMDGEGDGIPCENQWCGH